MADQEKISVSPQAETTGDNNFIDMSHGLLNDSGDIDSDQNISLPVLPVRDVVIFSNMIIPLFIGREKSLKTVEYALEHSRKLLVVAQKNEETDNPGEEDLFRVGTIVTIMRQIKVPDSRVKILWRSISRNR